MNIKNLHARNIHGYLKFDIDFKPDISYLDGINGSGKTTALRAIVSLLTPNFIWLTETEFSVLTVKVEHEGNTFTIRANKDDSKLVISVVEKKIVSEMPLELLHRYIEVVSEDSAFKPRASYYPEALRNKSVEFIRSLPTPMFLGLERTAQSDGELPGTNALLRSPRQTGRESGRRPSGNTRTSPTDISIEQATELAADAYREVRRGRAALTAELRSRVILAAFAKSGVSNGSEDRLPDAKTKTAYEKNSAAVQQALLQLGIPQRDIEKHVVPFFDEVTGLLADLPQGRISNILSETKTNQRSLNAIVSWLNHRFQIGFINNLTQAIEDHNANIRMVDAELDRYTKLVNKFLNDSNKSIEFTIESDFPLVRIDRGRTIPLRDLSSGEKQIVVILTHLSFNPSTRQANVLIIDEPEVSLHIHWQEIFVSSLREANPNTQIILATHSPSIILDDRSHSVGL